MIVKHLANIITFSRIIGSIVLAFMPVLSKGFFIVYTYSGLSDVVDGFVARKTHSESKLGSILDSISDLLFYTIMMIKIMPFLKKYLPKFVWVLIFVTLAIRIFLYSFIGITKHKFVSNHTYINKATGLLMFFLPYMINTNFFVQYSVVVSVVALLGALYELYIVFVGKRINIKLKGN